MKRVLVVDDSPTIRALLTSVLESHGWQVECAADGTTGAAMALSAPPDAVVSDLFMPGLSGLQLCRLLHEDPLTMHVPVVLLSAAGQRRARFWAARSGASAFVDKARAAEVPALLEKLTRAAPREAAVAPSARPVDAGAVPARLSERLDSALFVSVVASEVRGLALSSPDLAALFAGVCALFNELVSYRWLALSANTPAGSAACVHVPPDYDGAVAEAMRALAATGAPDVLLSDERCARPRPGAPTAPRVRTIEHAGVVLGRLAVAFDEDAGRVTGEDETLVTLAAAELALPLRLISVLEQTQRLAATDALTGIANRRSGAEALTRFVLAAERDPLPLSVILLDIDHFKSINDTYGHQAGDRALEAVAGTLRRSARKSDMIVRWGGEEFLAILRGTAAAGARVVGERLRAAIAAAPVRLPSGDEVRITASCGIASRASESAEQLVARADAALYDAKRRGRNRVEVAPPPARVAHQSSSGTVTAAADARSASSG